MFAETRYAMNGDLHVGYRASAEAERDIVLVANWFTNCEVLPEVPILHGWLDAMTSLGRLILFDQPGTGVSDPIDVGAMPTLEQWADSITAVLDDLGSREAALIAAAAAVAPAALFAATYPSRTTALVVQEGFAGRFDSPDDEWALKVEKVAGETWSTGDFHHLINPDIAMERGNSGESGAVQPLGRESHQGHGATRQHNGR